MQSMWFATDKCCAQDEIGNGAPKPGITPELAAVQDADRYTEIRALHARQLSSCVRPLHESALSSCLVTIACNALATHHVRMQALLQACCRKLIC